MWTHWAKFLQSMLFTIVTNCLTKEGRRRLRLPPTCCRISSFKRHLTVAFFLPGQHKWHHEYGLNFFASNFVRKGCMGNVFKWTISFRILFSLKKIFNILPSWRIYLASTKYSKFRIFRLRRVPTIWILYSIFVLYSQIQPQINSHLAGNVYI